MTMTLVSMTSQIKLCYPSNPSNILARRGVNFWPTWMKGEGREDGGMDGQKQGEKLGEKGRRISGGEASTGERGVQEGEKKGRRRGEEGRGRGGGGAQGEERGGRKGEQKEI